MLIIGKVGGEVANLRQGVLNATTNVICLRGSIHYHADIHHRRRVSRRNAPVKMWCSQV